MTAKGKRNSPETMSKRAASMKARKDKMGGEPRRRATEIKPNPAANDQYCDCDYTVRHRSQRTGALLWEERNSHIFD